MKNQLWGRFSGRLFLMAAVLLLAAACRKSTPTLGLLVWEGYADPSFIAGFEEKCLYADARPADREQDACPQARDSMLGAAPFIECGRQHRRQAQDHRGHDNQRVDQHIGAQSA